MFEVVWFVRLFLVRASKNFLFVFISEWRFPDLYISFLLLKFVVICCCCKHAGDTSNLVVVRIQSTSTRYISALLFI